MRYFTSFFLVLSHKNSVCSLFLQHTSTPASLFPLLGKHTWPAAFTLAGAALANDPVTSPTACSNKPSSKCSFLLLVPTSVLLLEPGQINLPNPQLLGHTPHLKSREVPITLQSPAFQPAWTNHSANTPP